MSNMVWSILSFIAVMAYGYFFKKMKNDIANEYIDEIERLREENFELKSDNRRMVQELLDITREKKEQEL